MMKMPLLAKLSVLNRVTQAVVSIEKPVVQRVQIREFVKARINAVVFFKPHPPRYPA
jgi:hypothetical protein